MRLLLISLDAVSRVDADRLLRLPALLALKGEGVFCDNVQTVYPTITYPIHTSIITGCWPEAHGIGHNQPFQPDTAPEMRKWFWEEGDIGRKTLHRAAKEAGLDVASVLWPVTGKSSSIRRNFPEVLPLPGESAVRKMLAYASPLWILHMELLYGRQRRSIRQPDLDDYAALLCEKLYASCRPPDVLTVHLVDCDAMRHRFGADSEEAYAAMERLDGRVGRMIEAVKKAGLYEETLICVVSDHGQQNARETVDLDKLLKDACGARAQSLGMGAYIFGNDLAAARKCLQENKELFRIGHIYGKEELTALHAPKNVSLAVDAAPGVRFGESAEGHLGDHGFAADAPEAKTLWWLAGPGVRRGATLPEARVVDIAPTLAYAMKLRLPDAQGRVIGEAFG